MKSKKLKGLFSQENKDWHNAGFMGGFKNCKEKVLKIINDDKSYRKSVFGYVNFTSSLLDKIEKL